MSPISPCSPRVRAAALTAGLLLAVVSAGCGDTADSTGDREARFGTPTYTPVEDPIEFEETSADVQGPTPIREVLDTEFPGSGDPDPVWFGYNPDDPYPFGPNSAFDEPCDTNFGNRVFELNDFPKTIRGRVTIHPQVYQKPTICGEDHRYYGSYIIQDDTGSIMVLKDTRIPDFSYGDVVEIEVLGLIRQFGTTAVLAYDAETVVETGGAVPYQTLQTTFAEKFDRDGPQWTGSTSCWGITQGGRNVGFQHPPRVGNSYRVRGQVCQVPTDLNFNEMVLQPEGGACQEDPDVSWTVSIGLELGKRNFDFERGEVITATGPVWGRLTGLAPCRWSFNLLAGRIGQLQRHSMNNNTVMNP
jgi:hypothetical protein